MIYIKNNVSTYSHKTPLYSTTLKSNYIPKGSSCLFGNIKDPPSLYTCIEYYVRI